MFAKVSKLLGSVFNGKDRTTTYPQPRPNYAAIAAVLQLDQWSEVEPILNSIPWSDSNPKKWFKRVCKAFARKLKSKGMRPQVVSQSHIATISQFLGPQGDVAVIGLLIMDLLASEEPQAPHVPLNNQTYNRQSQPFTQQSGTQADAQQWQSNTSRQQHAYAQQQRSRSSSQYQAYSQHRQPSTQQGQQETTTPPVNVFARSRPPVINNDTPISVLKLFLSQAGVSTEAIHHTDKSGLLRLAHVNSNAWQIRRILAAKQLCPMDDGYAAVFYKDILGAVTEQEAKATWKALTLQVHPDKNGGDAHAASEAFQYLSAAYDAVVAIA